jgi:hypothetical protein
MNLKDRRRFSRIATDNLDLNITFKVGGSQNVLNTNGRIVNVSLSGLQIETQNPIASSDVYLKVTDPENIPIEIRGSVVYCEKISPKKFHVGISFIGSNIEKYKFFSQLILIQDDTTTLEFDSIPNRIEKVSGIEDVHTEF